MFNGIIESIGTIQKIDIVGQSNRLYIEFDEKKFNDIKLGDSISVNGICLTIEDIRDKHLLFYTSQETNSKTNKFFCSQKVNLERSLLLGSRISGHFVFGHIDGIAKLIGIQHLDESQIWQFEIPHELLIYFAPKGSVAINGVSLTVNKVLKNSIEINLIPFTLEHTALRFNNLGDLLNIEIDMLARYVHTTLNKENE
ncbi:MAG: riboflavin synthase [Methylophilaceae bacterium]